MSAICLFVLCFLLFLSGNQAFNITFKNPRNSKSYKFALRISNSICKSKLLHMINNFLNDESNINALMNSGKGLNQLGNYEDCINMPTNRYVLLTVDGLPIVFNLGICAPIECEIYEYDSLKPGMAEILNDLIKSIAGNGTIDVNVTQNDVHFIDPQQINTEFTESRYGHNIVISVLILFVGMSILSTFLRSFYPQFSKENTISAQICQSFDLLTNIKSFLKTEDRHDQNLKIFNGFRVIAMVWVILGHSFLIGIFLSPNNRY